MNRCATCKHFITGEQPVDFRMRSTFIEHGDVNNEAIRNEHVAKPGWGQCGRIKPDNTSEEQDLSGEKAVAVDGDQYYAGLLCKPDFGCVLHEGHIDDNDPLFGLIFNAITGHAPPGISSFTQRWIVTKAVREAVREFDRKVRGP